MSLRRVLVVIAFAVVVAGCSRGPPEVCVDALAAYKAAVVGAPFDRTSPFYDHFIVLADQSRAHEHPKCRLVETFAQPVRDQRRDRSSIDSAAYVEAGLREKAVLNGRGEPVIMTAEDRADKAAHDKAVVAGHQRRADDAHNTAVGNWNRCLDRCKGVERSCNERANARSIVAADCQQTRYTCERACGACPAPCN